MSLRALLTLALASSLIFFGLMLDESLVSAKRRRKVKTRVDKKRSIALPVKAKKKRTNVPEFLRSLTALRGNGGYAMHMACSVCQHIVTHFVDALHYAESVDTGTITTGWRMDERKVVGLRGQDEKMMLVFDGLCDRESFRSMEQYAHCDEKTGKLCEDVPLTKRVADSVTRSCSDFREEFEEPLTRMARQYENHAKNDNNMPAEFCKQIRACTGEESKRHGTLFKARSEL